MNRPTVGILTFHRALNYGAVLQAHALKWVCGEMGCDAHIIDYDYDAGAELAGPIAGFCAAKNKKAALPNLVRGLLGQSGVKKRARAFSAFRRSYLAESAPCADAEEIAALGYDALIAGSDQIWNRGITQNRYDPVFFMDFETSARKILYGASAEDVPFRGEKGEAFATALKGLQGSVGIREQKLADYVEHLTGKAYPVVLDPTLLAGRGFLDAIDIPEPGEEAYILLYQISGNPESDIHVRSLEERFGCRAYTMTVPRLDARYGRRGTAGPEEFLSLLKGAKFLVTNSFHGIALSLLLHKQFFVYENGGVMSRIDSLLELAGLQNRKVKMVADIDPNFAVDYDAVDARLESARRDSLEFLQTALTSDEKPPMQRSKPECCGCSACMDVCPAKAITMEQDAEGFLYPRIDESKCIHCGKCDRVCSFHPFPERKAPYASPRAFGVKHIDLPTRESSRSGAAFVGFSDVILSRGGVIYGAAMSEDLTVSHIRALTAEERDRMKGAKYVQSDIREIYPQVASDLEQGRPVLFSGTPCQVAGLRGYLKERRISDEKLICCDMVCHGVPSPAIWKDYLSMIEQLHGKKILSANFRDKDLGWEAHCESVLLEGEQKKRFLREYTDLFYQHIMLRPSCSACPFCNTHRPGDLTMADFWGIEKHDPAFNDNRGVSLVLVNSPEGAALYEEARKAFTDFEADIAECLQPNLIRPSIPSPRRAQFWQDYQTMPFARFLRKYTRPLTASGRIRKLLKQTMFRLGIRRQPG